MYVGGEGTQMYCDILYMMIYIINYKNILSVKSDNIIVYMSLYDQ